MKTAILFLAAVLLAGCAAPRCRTTGECAAIAAVARNLQMQSLVNPPYATGAYHAPAYVPIPQQTTQGYHSVRCYRQGAYLNCDSFY